MACGADDGVDEDIMVSIMPCGAGWNQLKGAVLILAAAIGIQIGIGTEIDEKARNSTPIAIAISISTVQMCHN